ncbi:MAG: class I SAM-dependent methyltransferase [Bacteroidia bacterium]
MLDIGAGTGAFLNELKLAGHNVVGIEPDSDAVQVAMHKYGITLLPEYELLKFEPESFDVITMWHVLEHVPLLQKRVEELSKLLSPKGAIFIAVPNHESYDASYYGKYWAAYDVPRHLYHFDKQTIVRLFDLFNLELYEIKTMPSTVFMFLC